MSRVKLVLSIVVLSLFFMIVANYPNTITLELGVFLEVTGVYQVVKAIRLLMGL